MRARVAIVTLPLALGLLLAGCGSSGESEVKEWMAQTKRETRVYVPKLAEPKTFAPFTYGRRDSIDPFNPAKLEVALAKMRAKSSSGIKPDMDRPREALEQHPLDTIKMVGTLKKPGLSYAILQVDRLVYQAKVGNYLGQNFGMITGITEEGIDIKEIVQDASGEWAERKARLELQESKK